MQNTPVTADQVKVARVDWIIEELRQHLLALAIGKELVANKFSVHLTTGWRVVYIEQPVFTEARMDLAKTGKD
jgi:hypothetical protein